MWLPVDGFMWTETCWSSFYNFNYFNNLRVLQFVRISWKIKCLSLTKFEVCQIRNACVQSAELEEKMVVYFLPCLKECSLPNWTTGLQSPKSDLPVADHRMCSGVILSCSALRIITRKFGHVQHTSLPRKCILSCLLDTCVKVNGFGPNA